MSVTEEIKQRLDIVDLINQYVPLKKAGHNYKGLCPFHSEKTPSFMVFPDRQSWHCFGACSTGGDIFSFLMKKENLDFGEALQQLATRAGVELGRKGSESDQDSKRQLAMLKLAAERFHYLLKHSPAAQFARVYLEGRQVGPEMVDLFQLGFAPSEYEGVLNFLRAKEFSGKEIEAAGLAVANQSGVGFHDRFRGRLMFPIRNRAGETIAFGARALNPEDQPKYLNSPETRLFSKSGTLYGLDLAKEAIRTENLAVIVEGYLDVIAAHQAGFKNIVASLGTALTAKQIGLLKRLTKRVVLALDADAAGENATRRGLQVAEEALDRKQVPVLLGRGMIAFEEQLDAELSIIDLPAGRDPDEIITADPEGWRTLVTRAVPLIEYQFRVETRGLNLASWQGKEQGVQRLSGAIAEIKDPLLRDHYIQESARLLRVDERVMAERINGTRRMKRAGLSRSEPQSIHQASLEAYFLALALEQPEVAANLDLVEEEDLPSSEGFTFFELLQKWGRDPHRTNSAKFLEGFAEPYQELILQIRAEIESWQDSWDRLPETEMQAALEAAAYRMRLERLREESVQLTAMQRESQDEEEGRQLALRARELYASMARCQKELQARSVFGGASRLPQARAFGR